MAGASGRGLRIVTGERQRSIFKSEYVSGRRGTSCIEALVGGARRSPAVGL